MRTILATTEDSNKLERSELTADSQAGSNVLLNIENNNGMAQNTYVVIGVEGSEQAELVKINAAVGVGTTIQIDTLLFPHLAGEPVTVYKYNKRKFYGAVSKTGSYTELTGDGSPVTIQVDDPQGARLEYSGSTYNYFKATYYNSTTLAESAIADAEAVTGEESSRYCTLYAIRKQAGLTNNPYLTNGIVETYRKRAENEIKSYIMTRYTLPLAEVPAIIENVCTLLAAGYMDYQEFGRDGEGVKWLGEARGILNSLKKGTQRLIGADDTELAHIDTANTIQSFPDSVDNNNGPVRMFTSGQRF